VKKKKEDPKAIFEKQIDALPDFKGGMFLATTGMSKNFQKSVKSIVDA